MANTTTKFTGNFHMRIDDEFAQALDDLRALERPLLSRTEYVRRLVLETAKAMVKKGGRK